MTLAGVATVVLWLAGAVFLVAGTAGVLRFPDIYARLHALAKADNLGLGFIVLGAAVQAGRAAVILKLIAIWGLVLISSSLSCQLIASASRRAGIEPWRRP